LRGHQAAVSAAAFIDGGARLMSGGYYDGGIRLWAIAGDKS
jgi:hypothetical protein